MDLVGQLARQLGVGDDAARTLAVVVIGSLVVRVRKELGREEAEALQEALAELSTWRASAGMAAEVDAHRLAWFARRRGARAVALIAEVLQGLGVEPAGADLVTEVVREFLVARLGADEVARLAPLLPFLAGSEATPVPSGRVHLAESLRLRW